MACIQMLVGEAGVESIEVLISFIQQMHEVKPRNVWPKITKSKNVHFFCIFNFSCVLQLLRMSV